MGWGTVTGEHFVALSPAPLITSLTTIAASGAAQTLAGGNAYKLTLTADCTLTLTAAGSQEQTIDLFVFQDNPGAHAITFPGSVTFPPGMTPVMPQGAGAIMVVSLSTIDGGTTWYGTASAHANNFPGGVFVQTSIGGAAINLQPDGRIQVPITTGQLPSTSSLNAGVSSATPQAGGNSTRGKIQFVTTGAPPGAGVKLFTVTFANPYSAAVFVVLQSLSGGYGAYACDPTSGAGASFDVYSVAAMATGTWNLEYITLG